MNFGTDVYVEMLFAQQIIRKFKIQLLKTSGPNANEIGPPDYAILRDCYGENYYKTLIKTDGSMIWQYKDP